MNLSAPFIRRPVMTTLVMVALIFFGLYAFRSLPISDLPNIDYPTITVTALQPGGSPEYMADLIATPLERSFADISGLKNLASNNTTGQTQIVLNFDLNIDLESKEVEVSQAITETLPNLPPMPTNPTYRKVNPSQWPIIYLVLTSASQSLSEMYEIGYNILAQPISMVRGISRVQVYGYPYAVRVQADPMKLMSRDIDLNTLANALVNANPNFPSGTLQGRYEEWILNTFGMLSIGEAYNDVVIQQNEGIPLYVGDVARGVSALKERDPFFRYITPEAERNTVVLAISRLPDSNTLDISKAIFKQLPQLKKGIPSSIDLKVFFNKAEPIIDSVHEVELTLIIALILVVGVIFLYLGRIFETIIPSLVLPLAIIATFIFMYPLGFNIDILSLLALTLSIGFIVDDSIIVLENIVRHLEMGKSPYEAAMDGSKQISITVFTMTIALSAVFIPFIWMPGILGRIFHEFSLTIILAIFCSGFISLTLNPMLCSRFLRPRKGPTHRLARFSEKFNQKMIQGYLWLLHHSIRFKRTTVLIGVLCIVLSVLLLMHLKKDFLPPGNLDMVQGLHLLQQGSSRVNTNRHLLEVNEILRQYPYQDGFVSLGGYPTSDQGEFFMHLTKSGKRPAATKISRQLESELSDVVGVNTIIKPYAFINLQVGSTTSLGDYQYILMSPDAQALYNSARVFEQKMAAMPELIGVNSDLRIKSPQLNIFIDRDQAGVYGVTAEEIEATLRFAYSGGRISTFNKGINLYDLIVEVAPGFDLMSSDLDLLYIKSMTGELIPLRTLASWKEVPAPSSVNHINTFPSVTISFSLAGHAALGTVLDELDALAQKELPDDVVGKIQGTGEVFLETFQALKWLIILAIIVIYLLLGILYESFIHPITVLSALPIATLGGLTTLWIFNLPLSLYSVVGFIVLIGLVQKNGIMMIDFALEYMQIKEESAFEAILEACKARFRPIIMTTLAAMMGALPIAIGFGANAEANSALGLVIFGGLIFSQMITLFLTPVVFLYMQQFKDWLD